MRTTDIIIVGQGLAGSVLALALSELGYSVVIIDLPELSSSSKVAAGIWNPVVFKRLTKSWMIDELLPEMINFYKACERKFETHLITDRNILKFFSEEQEIILWKKKAMGELKDYLDPEIYHTEKAGIKNSPLGFSRVLKSGNLDLPVFLAKTRAFFSLSGSLLQETFDFSGLEIRNEIKYKNLTAKKIIFADGYLIKNNPFFNYIPFKPAKGETLTIKSEGLDLQNDILNKNMFLMPAGERSFKAGATYEWNELNDAPTEKARIELEFKLKKILNVPFEILEQSAGVRPAVIDRRPVIGPHPEYSNIYVFNGMGTKGVMLAPYFAKQLADHLQHNTKINPEADVQRFDKFFVN